MNISELRQTFTDIANAIRNKKKEERSYLITEFAENINDIPNDFENLDDIKFIDYKGEVVTGYTFSELLALTELPQAPDYTAVGLTFSQWNFTLEEIKEYANLNRKLIVGAIYIPTVGDLVVDITIGEGNIQFVDLPLNNAGTVTVDWGDGTVETMQPVTSLTIYTHTYANLGDYRIVLTKQDDSRLRIGQRQSGAPKNIFCNASQSLANLFDMSYLPRQIAIRNTVEVVYGLAEYMANLEYVNMESGYTSVDNYFSYCSSLKAIILHNEVFNLEDFSNECSSLEYISISNSPSNYQLPPDFLQYCARVKEFYFTKNITTLNGGSFRSCFGIKELDLFNVVNTGLEDLYRCGNLEKITIPKQLSTIGTSLCANNRGLKHIVLAEGITEIGERMFNDCTTVEVIENIENATSIGASSFSYCRALETFPTRIEAVTIPERIFDNCYLLKEMTIASTCTAINNYVFRNCMTMQSLIMEPTTPPNITSSSTIPQNADNLIIYVPVGAGETYKSATIWIAYADVIQERG